MPKKTTKNIKKILIANRGEIACRVIKTARKMGIVTVAVYSDADRKALHVRMADEAVHIGPSPAIESYLVIDKIIKAAKDTGADAIHPGYGFLSENPDFVRACQKAKITFIGPAPESMEAMGLKDAAKKLMDKAGVPITPGYHGKDQSPKLLKAKAGMIGYPVLIKAVAGGGGKGMRKVEAEEDFDAMLASCQREAKSSFNNDDVLIEKYIQSPRHIEVQVFGDSHGNVVHMFERDCSLQRRHQKVIEEAPAPGMTDTVRKAMTDAAIEAAKAVNYVGAGTVEFIVDGSGKLKKDGFWFMEMNTRLQVEHPVTEMITGLDLVELQIRVAQGEKLPKQKDIKMEGHAVEARLYAEDPANDFLPSVGQLSDFRTEYRNSSVRIDTGVMAGDVISIYYDPMIAKVIVGGHDRSFALDGLRQTLDNVFLKGVNSNIGFLTSIAYSQAFISADLSTHFIPEHESEIIHPDYSSHPDAYSLAASALYSEHKALNEDLWSESVWNDFSGWRMNQENRVSYGLGLDGMTTVKISEFGEYGQSKVQVGEQIKSTISAEYGVWLSPSEDLGGNWNYDYTEDAIELRQKGKIIIIPTRVGPTLLNTSSSNALTAPMPGKIIAVNAKAGDNVKAGDPLIIMEAMKMEMTLEAPRDGVVAEVTAAIDALVTDGEMLLSLEEIET